ncbi:tumor necrosis factor receptor superfamily member 14-like isoform X2 [Phycodurus eques]|uniref:tumor necrosis factor receptor superfamily member 14-like isoform X2 n=1 Tax=Phycodurus eques TaxID=693459 RepID=UPI002ACE4516|nr:tumor necrosis factor receptor superfamily member 14-like isoform X2 [Phycodurus eques]
MKAKIILIYVFRGFTLQCHQTEYQLNQEQCCPKCPTGSHVRNECTIDGGSTSCRLCMNRTYMNIPTGLKHCFPCTNCNAGSGLGIKRGCTTVSDAVCKPLDGFFCVDPVADGCLEARKHTECRPGQYISLKGPQRSSQQPPKNGCSPPKRAHKRPTGEGAKRGERKVARTPFNDTVCSECVGETFSNGKYTACQPHTKCESKSLLIKPGTASTDAECGEKHFHMCFVSVILICVLVPILFLFFTRKGEKNKALQRARQSRGTCSCFTPLTVSEEQTHS